MSVECSACGKAAGTCYGCVMRALATDPYRCPEQCPGGRCDKPIDHAGEHLDVDALDALIRTNVAASHG